jgi:hypothetical protein
MNLAVEAILEEYNARLASGDGSDADDVATLESLAAAIGPASELDLSCCKEFVEGVTFRVVVITRHGVALAAGLKRLDPLFAFLLHPRCCLVELLTLSDGDSSENETQCRRCVVVMHR